ncbi:DUF4241 domain-containing protein [Streptomyces sp. NPDC058398]|uniref:DUF4241 domain-containing protein n=1 Tax=Streptomyces sp. NPDC058398 TaxID=3346479 RepID=UPI003646147E
MSIVAGDQRVVRPEGRGMGKDAVRISYAEGWDGGGRRAFGPLTRAEAEERDRAGDPYVVLHRIPGRAVPVEVHLVSWRDRFVGHWEYDELGRRVREVDLRLLEEDRLFLRRYVERRYASPEQPDLAPDAWRLTVELLPGRAARKTLEERGGNGGSSHTLADVPEEGRWHDRRGFGVRAADGSRPPDGPEPGDGTRYETPSGGGEEPAALWRPPRPRRLEVSVDSLFRPGNSFPVEPWTKTVTAEPRHIAMVRIPTGRLAVSDPHDKEPRELAERVPPGAYRMETAVITGEGEFCGDRFPVTEEPAVRLVIRDEPAVAWELALSGGEDPRLLLDGHAYGFGTDGATGAFADAGAWETLSGRVRRYHEERDDAACESVGDGHLRAVDEATGSDLVSFCTGGDGTWPVWLGRSAAGELVAVVVVTSYL